LNRRERTMTKDSVINVGLIGCGGIMHARLNGYKSLRDAGYDGVRIKALCDINPEGIRQYRCKSEGPGPRAAAGAFKHYYVDEIQPECVPEAYTDHREMLEKAGLDAVEVYTSDSTHHSLAIDCLNAGKHVMVEKPMAISVLAGKRMVEAAKKKGLVLATAHCFRFEEAIRATRFVVEQGTLGALQVLSWCNVGRGDISKIKDRVSKAWRHSRLGTAGEALENGCHFMDTVRFMIGEVDEVLGRVETFEKIRREYDGNGNVVKEIENENTDSFFAIVRFENGAVGQVSHVNNAHGEPLSPKPLGYGLYGSKGSIKNPELVLDDGTRASVVDILEEKAPAELKGQYFPLGMKNRYALEVHSFLEAIRDGREAEVSGEEGLRDIAASWAIVESSARGCAVKVDDVKSGAIADCQKEIDEHYGLS